MNEEEMAHAFEAEDLFIVLPALRDYYNEEYRYPGMTLRPVSAVYHSANFPVLDRARLREFLLLPGVLPEEIVQHLKRGG
jgi:hypothetical protein